VSAGVMSQQLLATQAVYGRGVASFSTREETWFLSAGEWWLHQFP
jgi:hypothetical protein